MAQLTIQQAFELAMQHHQAGRLREAEQVYRQILTQQPQYAPATHFLAVIAQQVGRNDAAVELLQRAISLNPNYAESHGNLGMALRAIGRSDDAIAAYRRAIALKPDYVEAHYNLGNILREIGQADGAIAEWQKAIALRPTLNEAHNNLANLLRDTGRVDEAIAIYQQAIARDPTYADLHGNFGVALRDVGQLAEAAAKFRHAIALRPAYAEAHWNLALVLLTTGEFQQGWEEYEWRWKSSGFTSPLRSFLQPPWDGSPLAGRTILIYAEQGFGDTLQFMRYLPLVAERGGKIVFECQPELVSLLQPMIHPCQTLPLGAPLPHFDVRCSLMSLPRAFGTLLRSIPANLPAVQADPKKVGAWRGKLSPYAETIKVGLAWAGRPTFAGDRARSIPVVTLAPLAKVPGVLFFSLQKGDAAGQIAGLPSGLNLINLMADVHDFSDTAALIANLDLVISVDTAVAHLAGVMNKPTWTLLPFAGDWRWLTDRDDTPWYASMRLFRQCSRGDWDSVIARVVEALNALLNGRRPR